MTLAYFVCFSGISGDMTLGALVDAGLPIDVLRSELAKLNLPGYTLSSEKVRRSGLAATKVHVHLDDKDQPARRLGDIRSIINGSSLSPVVKQKGLSIFERLAQVRGKGPWDHAGEGPLSRGRRRGCPGGHRRLGHRTGAPRHYRDHRFPRRNIHSLPALDGARTDYRDISLPGFFLRVSPSGQRSFGLVYTNAKGLLRRLTIGATPPLSLATAREIARQRRAEIAKGCDPQAEKVAGRAAAQRQVTALHFSAVCDLFVADQWDDWRPSTRKGWTRYIEREIKPVLGDKHPEDLKPESIRTLDDRIKRGELAGTQPGGKTKWARKPAPVSARRCYEVIRRLCAWAVWRGYLPVSPCDQAKTLAKALPLAEEFTRGPLQVA